jgi:hypothetical protein
MDDPKGIAKTWSPVACHSEEECASGRDYDQDWRKRESFASALSEEHDNQQGQHRKERKRYRFDSAH